MLYNTHIRQGKSRQFYRGQTLSRRSAHQIASSTPPLKLVKNTQIKAQEEGQGSQSPECFNSGGNHGGARAAGFVWSHNRSLQS